MRKTILSVFVLGLWLASPAWSCGYRALESESDTFKSRLNSNMFVSQDEIKRSLRFVHKISEIEEKYKDPGQFEDMYSKISTVANTYYSQFFNDCYEIYYATPSLKTKVSIHLLLESVSEKYFRSIEEARQRRRLFEEASAEPSETISWADADRIFRTFFPDVRKLSLGAK
jgi:hypothetical protein